MGRHSHCFFQAEDGIRAGHVTGVQTCALPISSDSQSCISGIRSLTEFGNPVRAPSPISALPPGYECFEASPKAISDRTSYLRVRLAFHPYPHLIPAFFNIRGFGPPVSVT